MTSDSDDGFVDVEELTRVTKTINEVKYIIHYASQFDSACRSEDYDVRFVDEVSKLLDDTCPPKLLWALLLHFIRRPTGQTNLKHAFHRLMHDEQVRARIGAGILEEAKLLVKKKELTYIDYSIYRAVYPLFLDNDPSEIDEMNRDVESKRMKNILDHRPGGDIERLTDEISELLKEDKPRRLAKFLDDNGVNPIDKRDFVAIYGNDLLSRTSVLDLTAFLGLSECLDYIRSQVQRTSEIEADMYRHMILGRQVEMLQRLAINWDDVVIRTRVTDTILEMDDAIFFEFFCYKQFEADPTDLFKRIIEQDAILCLDVMRKHPTFLWNTYRIMKHQQGTILIESYLSGTRNWFHSRVQELEQLCRLDNYMNEAEMREFNDKITEKAREIGFGLSQHPEGRGRSMVYYCSYGTIRKSDKTTKKTQKCNCTFQIRLYHQENRGWHITRKDLDHTPHYMNPRFQGLSAEAKKVIQAMRQVRISPVQVVKIVNMGLGSDMTVADIKALEEADGDLNEVDELIQAVNTEGGITEEMIEFGKRHAVFIMRKREKQMIPYSDVIFIDGTHYPSKSGWTYIPISVLNGDLQVRTLAEFYTTLQNERAYVFLMSQLKKIPEICQSLTTIITDEESAFGAAFPTIKTMFESRWISHIICAWHKANRVQLRIRKGSFTDEEKEKLKSLLHTICYSRCSKVANEAVAEFSRIGDKDPDFSLYIRDHFLNILDSFAISWLPDCFNLGYNTSSVAESNNSRSKRGLSAKRYRMKELSDNVEVMELSSDNEQMYRDRLRDTGSLAKRCGIKCHGVLQKKIEGSLRKAMRLNVKQDGQRFFFEDPLHDEEVFRVSGGACDCRKLEMTGLPCSHLMWLELSRYASGQSPRIWKDEWTRSRFRYTLGPPELTPAEAGALLRAAVQTNQPARGEREAGGPQASEDGTAKGAEEERHILRGATTGAQKRYQKLNELANPIISRASQYEEMTQLVRDALTDLGRKLLEETAEAPIRDVGRPRLRRYPGPGG